MVSLLQDPDVQRYLQLYGDDDPDKTQELLTNPAFANDPDALAFAGLPPPQAPSQVEKFNAGQPSYVQPSVTPGPEAYLNEGTPPPEPSPQIQAFVEQVRKQNEPAQPPASPLAPVRGVPGALQSQAANVAQTREDADAAAIAAKEEELRILRESQAQRRGQIEAERAAKLEEDARQAATQAQLNQQLTEIGQEKDAPLDPGRYVANMGTGGTLLAGALAFAYGFMRPNDTSNPIAKVINDGIERDIHSQELAIRDAKDQRANRLGILRDKLGSTDAARARLRIELADLAEKQLDAETKDTHAQIDQVGLGATKQALAAERAKGVMELQQALYRMQPKAGGGMTAQKQAAEMKARIEMRQMEESGKTPDQLKALESERAADERAESKAAASSKATATKDAQKLGTDLEKLVPARIALEKAREAAGIERDEASGRLVDRGDLKGVGVGDRFVHAITPGGTESGRGVDLTRKNLKDTLGRMRSGGAITKDELTTYSELIDAMTEANYTQNLDQLDDFFGQVEQRTRGAYSTDAVEMYDFGQGRESDRKKGGGNPYGGVRY